MATETDDSTGFSPGNIFVLNLNKLLIDCVKIETDRSVDLYRRLDVL